MDIKIGLLGGGTIGSGVYELLRRNGLEYEKKIGNKITVKKVLVKNIDEKRAFKIPKEKLTQSFEEIINDEEISIVVELMGGIDFSNKCISQALKNGKSVITANKDLMAINGSKLMKIANENEVDLYFEAAVAGAIPIIVGLREGLASENIKKIMGIVNGTTNYILSKMQNDGLTYEAALQKAQELGFAESDPSADVEGVDAARKIAILSSLAFSMDIGLDDVYIKGISKISKEDIEAVKDLGYVIKLIGMTRIDRGQVEASVEPTLLSTSHPLASVSNENNAVYVYGEFSEESMFYGKGAGSLPTAMAVVSDLLRASKNIELAIRGKDNWQPINKKKLKANDKVEAKYYLRLEVEDKVGVLRDVSSTLSDYNISLESMMQRNSNSKNVNIGLVTHTVILDDFLKALDRLKKLPSVIDIKTCYRVE